MKDKIVGIWNSLSVAQGLVLVGVCAIAALTAIHLPPETWERIAEKDPADVGMRIGLLLVAIAGVFTKSKGEGE
jgi:Na+(H+)/acetate symporter ActP